MGNIFILLNERKTLKQLIINTSKIISVFVNRKGETVVLTERVGDFYPFSYKVIQSIDAIAMMLSN